MNKEQIKAFIQALVDSGEVYLIQNNQQGCYQLALKEGKEADATNDSVWELDVEEYNG